MQTFLSFLRQLFNSKDSALSLINWFKRPRSGDLVIIHRGRTWAGQHSFHLNANNTFTGAGLILQLTAAEEIRWQTLNVKSCPQSWVSVKSYTHFNTHFPISTGQMCC